MPHVIKTQGEYPMLMIRKGGIASIVSIIMKAARLHRKENWLKNTQSSEIAVT